MCTVHIAARDLAWWREARRPSHAYRYACAGGCSRCFNELEHGQSLPHPLYDVAGHPQLQEQLLANKLDCSWPPAATIILFSTTIFWNFDAQYSSPHLHPHPHHHHLHLHLPWTCTSPLHPSSRCEDVAPEGSLVLISDLAPNPSRPTDPECRLAGHSLDRWRHSLHTFGYPHENNNLSRKG